MSDKPRRQVNIGGHIIDRDAQLLDLSRADCEESFYEFYKQAWPIIDSNTWYDSWVIQALCEHLEAVCDGRIKRLLINIIPRAGKSNVCSVAFPAWVWAQRTRGPISGPQVSFLCTSYSSQLTIRDSVKCRQLIDSKWYQDRWGDRFKLSSDQNTKSRFSNDQGGERLVSSVDGTNTGEGAMCIINDDPNAAGEAFSEKSIENTINWWKGTMSSRLNNAKLGAKIVIQQRLSEDDLSGYILDNDEDGEWTYLMLPMEYEPERAFMTTIGWIDPRTEPGESLWPERFDAKEIKSLKKEMGPVNWPGQLQQRPEPPGGGIIKRDWWLLWPHKTFPPFDYIIATVDTAYTEDEMNDPSGCIVWGLWSGAMAEKPTRYTNRRGKMVMMDEQEYVQETPKIMMIYAWTEHLEFHELVKKVAWTAKQFQVHDVIIENKASGISVAQEIRRQFSQEKYGVQFFDPKSQNKTARLTSVVPIFADGTVFAPDKQWAESVISQVAKHPKGKHDEFVDCTSMALKHFRDLGLLSRPVERLAELDSMKAYTGRPEPLYPV